MTWINADQTYHLVISTGAGLSWNFFVKIVNPMDQAMQVKLDFLDQIVTNDAFQLPTCLDYHTPNDFASHMSWDTGVLSIGPTSEIVLTGVFNYNYCFDWPSKGCVEAYDASNGYSPGMMSFLDINITRDWANCNKYTVKALPSFRKWTFDFTGFMAQWIGDDYSAMTGNNFVDSWTISFSGDGVGQFNYSFPNDGSGFLLLLKPRSYLSVGYTWIFNLSDTWAISFTDKLSLPSNVYSSGRFDKTYMSDLPVIQWLNGDRSLLVPGDVNQNDYIGASDLALINGGLTVNFDPVDVDFDLDRDGYITSTDQSIIIQNLTRNWFRRYFQNLTLSWYLTWNDTTPVQWDYPWNQ